MHCLSTSPCGWCGDLNPDSAIRCASCGVFFGLFANNPDVVLGTMEFQVNSSANSTKHSEWIPLHPPAKVGPLTLHADGRCVSPSGFTFSVGSSFEKALEDGCRISVVDSEVTIHAAGEELKARYSEKRWHLFLPSRPALAASTVSDRQVAFPGVPYTGVDDIEVSHQLEPVVMASNGRSLEQYAYQLIRAIRESTLPVLVCWDGQYCGKSQVFGLVCRKRFMGLSWNATHIVCRVLGDSFSIEIKSGLLQFSENPNEIRRLRAGYWPIVAKWMLYVTLYLVAVLVLHRLLTHESIQSSLEQFTGRSRQTLAWAGNLLRFAASIWACMTFASWVDRLRALLHFQSIDLSKPQHLSSASGAFDLAKGPKLWPIFLFFVWILVFLILPDIRNGLNSGQQMPPAYRAFMLLPPELFVFLPKTIQLFWHALWGQGVGRPRGFVLYDGSGTIEGALYPNATDSCSLHQSLCRIVQTIR